MSGPVLPGAEPFSAVGGRNGALVLHGFTGSPHSMRGVAEALADAGFSVELPLLPGHGTDVADLLPLGFPDWLEAAEAAYVSLAAHCDRVVVVGLSMGGTLACVLASRHPEIAGVVVVNPYLAPPAASFIELLESFSLAGATLVPGIGADVKKPGVVPTGYDQTPIAPLLSLVSAVSGVAPTLASIACPVLLFSSRVDHVVPTESGDLLARSCGGPVERVFLDSSYHVATMDEDAGEIEVRTVAFVEKLSS